MTLKGLVKIRLRYRHTVYFFLIRHGCKNIHFQEVRGLGQSRILIISLLNRMEFYHFFFFKFSQVRIKILPILLTQTELIKKKEESNELFGIIALHSHIIFYAFGSFFLRSVIDFLRKLFYHLRQNALFLLQSLVSISEVEWDQKSLHFHQKALRYFILSNKSFGFKGKERTKNG